MTLYHIILHYELASIFIQPCFTYQLDLLHSPLFVALSCCSVTTVKSRNVLKGYYLSAKSSKDIHSSLPCSEPESCLRHPYTPIRVRLR